MAQHRRTQSLSSHGTCVLWFSVLLSEEQKRTLLLTQLPWFWKTLFPNKAIGLAHTVENYRIFLVPWDTSITDPTLHNKEQKQRLKMS